MTSPAIRLNELIEFYGLSPAEFAKEVNLPKSSISMWLSGKRTMRQDKIGIIANRFNINPAWLMGYDDVPMKMDDIIRIPVREGSEELIDKLAENAVKVLNRQSSLAETLTTEEMDLIEVFRTFDEEGKNFIKSVADHEKNRLEKIKGLKSCTEPELIAAHSEDPSVEHIQEDAEILKQTLKKNK